MKGRTLLETLAVKHSSDKFGHHDYCRHYEAHFQPIFHRAVTLLELGVGGYDFPDRGGSGLRMWAEYFNHKDSKIFGIDIHDKSELKLPKNVKVFQGSQDDGHFLTTVMQEVSAPDIIIDDASHMNFRTIDSFKHLFPWLKPGGIYCIEDIESSWWNEHGFDGTPDYMNFNADTTINFCRMLTNPVNAKHIPQPHNAMFRYEIESVHFYQNLVIIKKK